MLTPTLTCWAWAATTRCVGCDVDVRLRPVFVGAVRHSLLAIGGDGSSSIGCVNVGGNSGSSCLKCVSLAQQWKISPPLLIPKHAPWHHRRCN